MTDKQYSEDLYRKLARKETLRYMQPEKNLTELDILKIKGELVVKEIPEHSRLTRLENIVPMDLSKAREIVKYEYINYLGGTHAEEVLEETSDDSDKAKKRGRSENDEILQKYNLVDRHTLYCQYG